MERRTFVKSVGALPFVSLPSIDQPEEFWEIDSEWFSKSDFGRIRLIENGEEQHTFHYDNYQLWQKTTLLNARFVADSGSTSTDYVADLFSLNLKKIYIDPPYFFSRFSGERSEVQIRQGKYASTEFVYVLEQHNEEALEGYSGGADSLSNVVEEVAEWLE
ncbi:hypothetical protein ACFQGE_10170 [Halomicroarcula sp. GCM10025817]|uniref:hypothetical protein n=1 Tax=Haloarcula TaxID=2237 RepID=UPI0023E7CDD0|nr:hypothetical protein [Halomicroarcula sp. SYNS111]